MNLKTSFFFTNQYQTWLEINSSALNNNILFYKNHIGNTNKLAFVIKGNGYGHGMNEIATICDTHPLVDYFCITHLSEAITLRSIGIKKPLLLLGYSNINPEIAIHKNIDFMVDNVDYATILNETGKKHKYQFPIHIKVDTGLCRMGINSSHIIDFIKKIRSLPYLSIIGLCSHFAASDTDPEFTRKQLTLFNSIIHELSSNSLQIPFIHMSNTGSFKTVSNDKQFNFFRIGRGIYGLDPQENNLTSIMTWKTRIMNIKTIPTGSYVSYAGEFKTTRPTRIALLPIGYFDGYNFRLSNKSSVLINGSYAPIRGRIAMNMTIVDITDIDAQLYDEVIVLGNYPQLHAWDLASIADIKNVREIVTTINPTIPRIIVG